MTYEKAKRIQNCFEWARVILIFLIGLLLFWAASE